MAFLKIDNVAIRGISACVPPKVEENRDIPFYTQEEAEKVIEQKKIIEKKKLAEEIVETNKIFALRKEQQLKQEKEQDLKILKYNMEKSKKDEEGDEKSLTILDRELFYTCGASFKDLGKKSFAINEFHDTKYLVKILEILNL